VNPLPPGPDPLPAPLTLGRILHTWWPLALSWLMMALELPAQSAVVARLANPEVNLAAYGGIVMPLAMIIESPIVMLLSASTALSKDWASYLKLRRFMVIAGATLTLLHIVVAFTPVYDVLVRGVIGPPPEVVAPGRLGLMLVVPWAWAIAFRRFNQGVLIRFGHSRAVGLGTFVRLGADGLVLAAGLLTGWLPGIVVAAGALALGVTCEAVYVGLRVRPVLRDELRWARPVEPPLTWRAFRSFYVPLALMQLIALLVEPLGSVAISRMPDPLASLAVWPVLTGLLFMMQSLGVAYNEVVIALLDEPGAALRLRRFLLGLAAVSIVLPLLVAGSPLADLWFGRVSALPPALVELARMGLWLAMAWPVLSALYSWLQANIVHSRRTGAITEGVLVYVAISAAGLGLGVAWGQVPGLLVAATAFTLGGICQTGWLWWRSRSLAVRVTYGTAAAGDR